MLKTMLWGALIVATSLLNTCIYVLSKLDKNWPSYEQKIIYAHIWTYAQNMIDFGPLIRQISIFLNETNFI